MNFYKHKNRIPANETNSQELKHGSIDQNSTKTHFSNHPILKFLKRKSFKGLKGHSLYDVGKYFFRSMFLENLNIRAASLSFNFFVALFPALIFLLTLIAYLPFKGLKTQFINQLALILPKKTYIEISSTIMEILHKQNSGLMSFGFILTIYFSSNAFHLMITTFNRRIAIPQKRNWFHIRGKAVFLTFWISLLVIIFLVLLTLGFQVESYMESHQWPLFTFYSFLLNVFKYLLISALFLFAISSIYYFAPSNHKRWEFFSTGAVFTTITSIIMTFGFSIYVNNFDSYNKVYGSIGAILALTMLIYLNIMLIIIGFELNASIDKVEIQKARKNKTEI